MGNWLIKIHTIGGGVHEFRMVNRTAAEMQKLRRFISTSAMLEFVQRQTEYTEVFVRSNIIKITIEKTEGGSDVGDQYDTVN